MHIIHTIKMLQKRQWNLLQIHKNMYEIYMLKESQSHQVHYSLSKLDMFMLGALKVVFQLYTL